MNLCRVQKALWGEYLVLCEAGSWSELKSGSNILTCNEPRCETGLTEYARRSTFQFQIYANLKTSATRWRIVKWSKRRAIKGFICCGARSRELSLLKGEKSESKTKQYETIENYRVLCALDGSPPIDGSSGSSEWTSAVLEAQDNRGSRTCLHREYNSSAEETVPQWIFTWSPRPLQKVRLMTCQSVQLSTYNTTRFITHEIPDIPILIYRINNND